MSDRVNRLIHTSADDCKASMFHEKSLKVLNAALKEANKLGPGYKTKAKHIAKRIKELRGQK